MRLPEVFRTLRLFLRSELASDQGRELSWRRRLWLYRHGFLSSSASIWDLTDETVDLYLSDREYRRIAGVDSPYSDALRNKVLFYLTLSPTYSQLLPRVYGLVRNGTFVDTGEAGSVASVDELVDCLDDGTIVVKPVTAAKGAGVHVVDRHDGAVRIDGQRATRADLVGLLSSGPDLLLTEHVRHAAYADEIYPDATNTIRLLTMVDPETGVPFVASAVHRFGTVASGRVDNWSAGGISAGIDTDTGELTTVVAPQSDGSETFVWRETHPDTGVQVTGRTVPGWERVKATVLDLAATYGWVWPYVGWDVVVRSDDGQIAVLEGEPQSVDADQQAHGPLLADDRVRRFCDQHGVLVGRQRRLV